MCVCVGPGAGWGELGAGQQDALGILQEDPCGLWASLLIFALPREQKVWEKFSCRECSQECGAGALQWGPRGPHGSTRLSQRH